ncbi:MAG: cobalt-precorrin-5B (C(1))-methyltransferase [Prevotella sp.]|nr:cobalt-precorrin-5B (C(1))-methyltransferase [Prevotella sp.]
MILVFGGTTEGRQTVRTLEEAGSLYYYSTRSDGQQVELVHGRRLEGDLDVPKMIELCRECGIRLLVDAAHPFAEELHRNLLYVAHHTATPIIRYDRIYPPRTADIVWCRNYDDAAARLAAHHVERLLALTGVNTIGRLKPYWQNHECWFRILNRKVSLLLARKNQFPEDHLAYYDEDDTPRLIAQLQPQAILTKESGLSGGFCEKVEAARQAGIPVFAVERPAYPPKIIDNEQRTIDNGRGVEIHTVNGPHGLRRMVEQLLPEFFPLHSGLTTGTCATAAAVAATMRLMQWTTDNGEAASVPVVLPDGETIDVPVGFADGYAYCIKVAGDDPDVTDGIEIRATVERSADNTPLSIANSSSLSLRIEGGQGVGRFTLPGFDYPPGEAAINRAPRQMIYDNIRRLVEAARLQQPLSLTVTISVPRGEETARKTFNPRLGIEGGISIIGVSGIVKPFSEEAFISSIRKCVEVAKASGAERLVINSGGKSERYVRALYPDLPQQAFVEYGNYIGETLRIASELGIRSVTMGVMLGKAVKLAQGHLDTHSRRTVMDKDFVASMLHEAGIELDLTDLTLARELWERIPKEKTGRFAHVVVSHCMAHCRPLLPDGQLTILLIDEQGNYFRLMT